MHSLFPWSNVSCMKFWCFLILVFVRVSSIFWVRQKCFEDYVVLISVASSFLAISGKWYPITWLHQKCVYGLTKIHRIAWANTKQVIHLYIRNSYCTAPVKQSNHISTRIFSRIHTYYLCIKWCSLDCCVHK